MDDWVQYTSYPQERSGGYYPLVLTGGRKVPPFYTRGPCPRISRRMIEMKEAQSFETAELNAATFGFKVARTALKSNDNVSNLSSQTLGKCKSVGRGTSRTSKIKIPEPYFEQNSESLPALRSISKENDKPYGTKSHLPLIESTNSGITSFITDSKFDETNLSSTELSMSNDSNVSSSASQIPVNLPRGKGKPVGRGPSRRSKIKVSEPYFEQKPESSPYLPSATNISDTSLKLDGKPVGANLSSPELPMSNDSNVSKLALLSLTPLNLPRGKNKPVGRGASRISKINTPEPYFEHQSQSSPALPSSSKADYKPFRKESNPPSIELTSPGITSFNVTKSFEASFETNRKPIGANVPFTELPTSKDNNVSNFAPQTPVPRGKGKPVRRGAFRKLSQSNATNVSSLTTLKK